MLRSLLVGIGESSWSDAACEIGVTWAANLRIPMTCLGVVDVAGLAPDDALSAEEGQIKVACDTETIERRREQVRAALLAATQRAKQANVECHILNRDGSPATLIGLEAQRHDLVILGRRADFSSDSSPPASETLLEILRQTPRPIIVTSQSIPSCSDVVIAYDGSVQAARTLQSFVASGLYYGHPLHLAGIGDSPDTVHQILGRALDFLRSHSLKAEPHVLPTHHSVAETLAEFVRKIPAGLLVMGTSGRPRFCEMFFGSVTRSVLANVPVPLFLNH